MANENDEIIQLIIDAKNISSDELDKAANDLEGLGDKAEKADDALEKLKLDDDVINSYREMADVTRKMKRELAESEVKYDSLTKAIKSNKNATNEQLIKAEQIKQALKDERRAVASQIKEYEKKKKELKELGIHSKNYTAEQAKLTAKIKEAEIESNNLTNSYKKQYAVLKTKYNAEKKASDILREKIAIDEKAAHVIDEAINATRNKIAIDEKAAQAQAKLATSLKGYELALDKLNKEKNEGVISTGDYIRSEEKLRKAWELSESQAKTTRRAIEADSKAKIIADKKSIDIAREKIRIDEKAAYVIDETINATRKKIAIDKELAKAHSKLTANLKSYEIALDKLNKEKNEGTISTGKYIRSEERLRKTWKLNESQAKATRRAVEADNKLMSKKSKSTDLLTTATRRLAQAYTVLLAAQKATEAVTSSVKGYSDLEAAITKVEKTTGIARDKVVEMADELRYLSEEITPAATNELLRYAETAGQMGVSSTEDILKIVAAADALGVSTNLAGEEAATLSTRILGMTGEGVSEIHKFASALVDLGNSTKTTEQEILHMTKEIVTGTNALGFGSAAAAGFGATLKELGQPAERSRSAMQDLSTVIIDMANEGGESLEKLIKITGLTADAIEEGLGEEPEQIVIRFIKGLKEAKDAGVTLKTSLAGIGITSKETNAVVGALAENTDRLAEVVNLSSAAYQDGTKHIEEASKRYADQESTLLRLGNKFTTLKTKIGEAYAPKVIEAIDTFSAAMDENGSSVIKVMELLPELVEGFNELITTGDDLFSVFGGLGDVFDNLTNAFKLSLNQLTFSIRTLGLGLNEIKIMWAELTNDTEENINRMKAASADIAKNMTKDLQDMADAQNRFDGVSSVAYENFIEITNKYKESIKDLSKEQQAEIEVLIQSNSLTGQAANYNKEYENSYRKLAAVLTRANLAKEIANKLEFNANKSSRDSVELEKIKVEAIRSTGLALSAYGENLKQIEIQREKGVLTDEQALAISNDVVEAMKVKTAELRKLTGVEQDSNVVKKTATDLTKESSEALKAAQTPIEEAVNTLDLLSNAYRDGAIELPDYIKWVKETIDTVNKSTATNVKATEVLDKNTVAVNSYLITQRKLDLDIKKLTNSQNDKNKSDAEQLEIATKLAALTEQRTDNSAKLALQQELESKTSFELLLIQQQQVEALTLLNDKWKSGTITTVEYIKAKEDAAFKTELLNQLLGDSADGLNEEADAANKAADALDRVAKAGKDNTEQLQEQNLELQKNAGHAGVSNALANRWLSLQKELTKSYDYTSLSAKDLANELDRLNREYSDFNLATAKATHDLIGVMKPLDDMTRAVNRNKVSILEETQALQYWIEGVQSGAFNLSQLNSMARQADSYFSKLSDNQLAPLRAAIKSARAEFAALSDEIDDTFDDLQDRLDRLKGDEASILSRQFKREMKELEDLLSEARKSGDDALIRKITQAIATLQNVGRLEARNLRDETATSTAVADQVKFGRGGKTSSQEYNVTIKLPDGTAKTVEVASSSDANALISALSALGEINIDGVE